MRLRWRFGVIAGLFLAFFCSYPQLKMWYERGDEWNGHYAYNDIDEVAYAAYVRALIDGRPRKNDPYTGRDDSENTPQPESLFSIQFAAPYTLAIPARIFGIGAPWAMTLSGVIAGFLAALAVFWFIGRLTGDPWFGMAAGLGVFAFGTLASGEGAILEVLFDGFSYPYFPGFRRYIPAMAFPAFFVLVGVVWKLLGTKDGEGEPGSERRQTLLILLGIGCFAYTVYSYFYVWTTAAAFLACVFAVWLAERPEGWKRDLRVLTTLGVGCVLTLIPYAYLLSQRSDTMDHVQLLVHTRAPDLFRFPEYVAFAVLVLVIAGMALKWVEIRDRRVLFTLALAVVPFVLFNQQIITGRSLQPIHYQVFIGNYVAALSLFAAIGTLWNSGFGQGRVLPKLACAAITFIAVIWGVVECHYTVRVLDWANDHRDKALPIAKRLEELAGNAPDRHRQTVLSFDGIVADDLPTVMPQNVLWARHQHVFAGLSWEESKERYYQQLYYSNVDEKGLDYLLKRDFVSQIALFGWGRHTDRLSSDAKPLTYAEIADEVKRYGEYIQTFGVKQATHPLLHYVVVENAENTDLSRLQLWYELDAGEMIGGHTLYRVKLRPGLGL
ncbi:MAG: hypothetical protein QUS14_12095 [Pyrinomonadaceae bacterium]|nr:hypothetical protein [Pyrinomonadaceae bacterium]